jgi:Flp pilus assembly protein CpaB
VSAAIAAGILAFALNRYRRSIETQAKGATVLVANRLIEKGTAGAAIGVGQFVSTTKILDKQVAQGALANTAALHGQVANTDIYPGQQLTAADFTPGGLFYSKLPPNLRAVAVPVNTAQGLIGNVQTGDRVDVYVSFKREGRNPAYVRLVAPNVVVLDAAQKSSGGLGTSTANTSASDVLEVSAHQAAELAFGSDFGKIWLVLRPADGTSPGNERVSEFSILTENGEGTKR